MFFFDNIVTIQFVGWGVLYLFKMQDNF